MKQWILVLLASILALPGFAEAGPKPRLFLNIEPVLVRESGIEPLSAPDKELTRVDRWGAFNQIVSDGDGTRLVVYRLEYRTLPDDRLALKLERSPIEPGGTPFPVVEKTVSVLDSWRTPLVERTADGGRLDLRVTPVIRAGVADERFEGSRFSMNFEGGPLVVYGDDTAQDQVIFRAVNVGGARGLDLGVSGVGQLRLAMEPFEGAVECGWVRGHQLICNLEGTSLSLWSNTQILPDDPGRPGRGWKIWGRVARDASRPPGEGYYGSFDPADPPPFGTR